MIFYLLSLVGIVTGFICLTLAIASGLYYLSELVEEHGEVTKRTLNKTIYAIVFVLILLWLFESFPFFLVAFSICLNVLYLKTLSKFPYLKIDNPDFILSGVLTFINHYLWFNHFNAIANNRYSYDKVPSFSEISSFFGLCVWLIPFALFISLSAGENLLPSNSSNLDESGSISIDSEQYKKLGRKSKGLIKEVLTNVKDSVFGSSDRSKGLL